MNETNKLKKADEGPAPHAAETSELRAIVGGQDGGHGHSEQISFHPVPGYPTSWLPHPPIDPVPVLGGK
jgi:hypothetical protein